MENKYTDPKWVEQRIESPCIKIDLIMLFS